MPFVITYGFTNEVVENNACLNPPTRSPIAKIC